MKNKEIYDLLVIGYLLAFLLQHLSRIIQKEKLQLLRQVGGLEVDLVHVKVKGFPVGNLIMDLQISIYLIKVIMNHLKDLFMSY